MSSLSSEVVSALYQALGDNEGQVRAEAAKAMGNIGTPPVDTRAVARLVELLKQDKEPLVRESCADALGLLGESGVACLSQPKSAVVALEGALKDSFWKVRFTSCVALGKLGPAGNSAVPALLAFMKDGRIKRQVVAASLAEMGEAGIEAMLNILLSEGSLHYNSQVRIAAAYGLSLCPLQCRRVNDVVDTLFAASSDRVPLVRRAVLEGIGSMSRRAKESVPFLRTRSVLPFLYAFLKDRDGAVRDAAAEQLALAGPHGELLLIEGLLKDSQPLIRQGAAHGLMHIGPRAIRSLLLGLADPDSNVRLAVASAIEAMTFPTILSNLREKPPGVRSNVVVTAQETLQCPYPLSSSIRALLQQLVQELS